MRPRAMVVVAACLLPVACGTDGGPVVFGATGDWETGDLETLRDGMELAVEKVNATGGVDGRPVQLRFANDGGTDPDRAVSAAEELTETSSLRAVMAGGGSFNIANALPVYNGVVPLIAVMAASPAPGGAWSWELNIPASAFADATVEALDSLGAGPVGLVFDNTPGGRALAAALRERLPREPVVVQPLFTEELMGDFRPVVEALAHHGVERVILATATGAGRRFLRLIRELAPDARVVVFDQILPLLGIPELAGARIVLPSYTGRGGLLADRAFAEEYEKRFGREPDGFAALGYDAVRLLTRAAREAGTDREEIAGWLSSLGERSAHRGATGPIWFDEQGARRGLDARVGIICSGGRVIIEGACP